MNLMERIANMNKHERELILLIQTDKKYRLAGADKLKFTAQMEDVEMRINTVKNVLRRLKAGVVTKGDETV